MEPLLKIISFQLATTMMLTNNILVLLFTIVICTIIRKYYYYYSLYIYQYIVQVKPILLKLMSKNQSMI